MIVIHRAHGYRFVIYLHDHEPAHVHLVGAGLAKVHLLGPGGRPELVEAVGLKAGELRRLLAEVAERRDEFLQEWERIHGRSD